jgi:hypothetical protein
MRRDLDVVGREHVFQAMVEVLIKGEEWLYATTASARPAKARNHFTTFERTRFPSKALAVRAWQIATGANGRPEAWLYTNETTERLRELGFNTQSTPEEG